MAGNGDYGDRRVDGGVAKEVKAQLGFLAVSAEQRTLDCLGYRRQGMGAHRFAAGAGGDEYSRRGKERAARFLRLSQIPAVFYFAFFDSFPISSFFCMPLLSTRRSLRLIESSTAEDHSGNT